MTPPSSIVPYGAAALVLLCSVTLVLPGPRSDAASARAPAAVELTGAATATMPAVRLGRVGLGFFPMAPAPRCDILDNFGDPRSGGRRHEGVDMLATLGQQVYAVVDGTLTFQAKVGDGTAGAALSGNLWRLTAPDGTYYVYAHLSAFAPGLVKGSAVRRGQVIGFVGDTGNPGPGNYHLHFEIHPRGGAAVDPLPLLEIPSACRVF
jgi:murein DD-endopeptidase MepM/ murein hydrolase activator NlpD